MSHAFPMKNVSPWVWVALVALCFVAQFVFVRFHVDGAGMVALVLGVAMAGLGAQAHARTSTELTELRKSIRPRREPSYPDLPPISRG